MIKTSKTQPALVPVVVQDAADNKVLMLAYADREALTQTLETGEGWYYSRSRGRLWRKGETSGHTQRLADASLDCDGDAVLVRVEQTGPACHTGEKSCFHRPLNGAALPEVRFGDGHGSLGFLQSLERLIEERDAVRQPGSYVSGLFAEGPPRVYQKLGEEAVEFIIAATAATADVREEAADLLFHMLVAFRAAGLTLSDVALLLDARHRGRSAGGGPSPETSPRPRT